MKKNKVNTRELLRHSFDLMMALKENQIGVEEAKAQANLIKQSNNLLRYELDKAVAYKKFEGLEVKDIED